MVSIVMPAWNEAEIIEACVREWHGEVISKLPGSELIIVDDSARTRLAALSAAWGNSSTVWNASVRSGMAVMAKRSVQGLTTQPDHLFSRPTATASICLRISGNFGELRARRTSFSAFGPAEPMARRAS